MPQRSAGILAYRRKGTRLEVLLVHPGGPFWRNKDLGAWSIPKGEFAAEGDPQATARREFAEELGIEMSAPLHELGDIKQAGGKVVTAYAAAFDLDPREIRSNTFELEWPPRGGKRQSVPEVDRAEWFSIRKAQEKINKGQRPLLDRLEALLREPRRPSAG